MIVKLLTSVIRHEFVYPNKKDQKIHEEKELYAADMLRSIALEYRTVTMNKFLNSKSRKDKSEEKKENFLQMIVTERDKFLRFHGLKYKILNHDVIKKNDLEKYQLPHFVSLSDECAVFDEEFIIEILNPKQFNLCKLKDKNFPEYFRIISYDNNTSS